MDRAVVPTAEEGEVRQYCRASVGPVTDVMALSKTDAAPGETTTAISVLKRPAQRRRDRSSAGADRGDTAVGVVAHHHSAGIACQAPRRFCGNVCSVLEDGLARCIRVRQDRGLDVNPDLGPPPRCSP